MRLTKMFDKKTLRKVMRFTSAKCITYFLLVQVVTSALASQKVRMCYFTNWSQYRVGLGRFMPGNIDPFLCTHLLYAFAHVDDAFDTVRTVEYNDAHFYRHVVTLKELNPQLKVLLAIGGAVQGTVNFDAVSRSETKTRNFVANVINFLRENGFDGLDVDWEFPDEDSKSDYQRFIKQLYIGFMTEALQSDKDRLELTIAVSGNPDSVASSYGPSEIVDYVDYVMLMAYDLWGIWSKTLGHHSPLYAVIPGDEEQGRFSMDMLVDEWVKYGAPKDKLVLGMSTYGRTGVLNSSSQHQPGDPWARHMGTAGPITRAIGYLAYYEICRNLKQEEWRAENSTTGNVPYAWNPRTLQYVCYDDVSSFDAKANYIMEEGLAGAMFWTLDFDDFTGRFCDEEPYPLLRRVKSILDNSTEDGPAPSQAPLRTVRTTLSGNAKRTVITTRATIGPPAFPSAAPAGACPPFKCKNAFGFFPDTADCSRFYQCVRTVAHRVKCPPGLLFDSHMGLCNWPTLVRCHIRC